MLNKKLFKLEKKKNSFLSNLYYILNNTTYKEIIYWIKKVKVSLFLVLINLVL